MFYLQSNLLYFFFLSEITSNSFSSFYFLLILQKAGNVNWCIQGQNCNIYISNDIQVGQCFNKETQNKPVLDVTVNSLFFSFPTKGFIFSPISNGNKTLYTKFKRKHRETNPKHF